MKPAWKVIGDAGDFTPYLSRMISLSVEDQIGLESDRFTITLEDNEPEHELPASDAQVNVYIGYDETGLTHKGTYKYDSASGKGPMQTLTLNFTAADMKGPLKARRSESYHDTTLGDIGKKVSERSGMEVHFLGDAASKKVAHEDQTSESDMAFLLRIAKERGMIAKPSFGKIVIGKPGDEEPIVHELAITDITDYTWNIAARGQAKKVKARVDDLKSGKSKYVIGEGEDDIDEGATDVTRELLTGYYSEDEAKEAIAADKEANDQASATANIEMPGDPKFFAGHKVNLGDGFSVKVQGEWTIKSVTDSIGVKYTTSLSLERKDSVMGDKESGKDGTKKGSTKKGDKKSSGGETKSGSNHIRFKTEEGEYSL